MNDLAKDFRDQALVVELDVTDAGQRESAVKAWRDHFRNLYEEG
jgi:NADP-dependent 3-hydroxy acid dehydrogenase YdfG